MTAVFHEIHSDQELESKLRENRPPNHDFDEVLSADDTILASTNEATAERLLHRVEHIAAQYGLHLNKDKCDAISTKPSLFK